MKKNHFLVRAMCKKFNFEMSPKSYELYVDTMHLNEQYCLYCEANQSLLLRNKTKKEGLDLVFSNDLLLFYSIVVHEMEMKL